ncbi:MAG: adenylyltransferase/cytidyltransferase family protein, partial [Akkermansiaceae bacterium]
MKEGKDPEEVSVLRRKRIGIFGGSFDPVHEGHIYLAALAKAEADLDEIW